MRIAPLNGSLMHGADAMRVRDHDRTFDKAGFLDPGRASHFAISIERKPATEYRLVIADLTARQNGGHAGPNRGAVRQIINDGFETDRYAGDIGDRIQ